LRQSGNVVLVIRRYDSLLYFQSNGKEQLNTDKKGKHLTQWMIKSAFPYPTIVRISFARDLDKSNAAINTIPDDSSYVNAM